MNPFRRGSEPMARPAPTSHPLMQAFIDRDLPYLVVTDHAVWGSFAEHGDAIALAGRVADAEPVGERVFVMYRDIVYHQTRGRNQTQRMSAVRR